MTYNNYVMQDKYEDLNTFWLTFELMLRMKPRFIESAVKRGLTTQQLHVLGFLSDNRPHPMSWMAALLSCDASNVTGIVDRLVAMDLVERVENEKDRRVKMIQLTKHGEKMRAEVMAELTHDSQERIDSMLTREEQKVFRDIVIKLLKTTEAEALEACPVAKIYEKIKSRS